MTISWSNGRFTATKIDQHAAKYNLQRSQAASTWQVFDVDTVDRGAGQARPCDAQALRERLLDAVYRQVDAVLPISGPAPVRP